MASLGIVLAGFMQRMWCSICQTLIMLQTNGALTALLFRTEQNAILCCMFIRQMVYRNTWMFGLECYSNRWTLCLSSLQHSPLVLTRPWETCSLLVHLEKNTQPWVKMSGMSLNNESNGWAEETCCLWRLQAGLQMHFNKIKASLAWCACALLFATWSDIVLTETYSAVQCHGNTNALLAWV